MGRWFRVVETDNFGSDYPDERFTGPPLTEEDANRVADTFNEATHADHPRFWKVVPVGYKLRPGFEP
jgi:hypothetical protein